MLTNLRGFRYGIPGRSTRLRGFRYEQSPPPTMAGASSPWDLAWKRGVKFSAGKWRKADLAVTISSSGGHEDAIECAATEIVIAQSESSNQEIHISLLDPGYELHPYGNGAHKDALKNGSEVKVSVTYGGRTRDFFAIFERPTIQRSGPGAPTYTWSGKDYPSKLFKNRKDFETLGWDFLKPAPTNVQALAEACNAVGVQHNWSGITPLRLGGPYHRQQKTPAEVVAEVLGLTFEEWRTEGKGIVGYNPGVGGRVWVYDVDLDSVIREHSVQPANNDEHKKVKVLRPIPTGSSVSDGGVVECDNFGPGNSITFDPPLNGIRWDYEYRHPNGAISYIDMYREGALVACRRVINPLDRPQHLQLAFAYEIDEIRFVWGASSPNVPMDVTSAKGAVRFRGKPSLKGTVGSEENERPPLDKTTVKFVGTGPDEDAFELAPNQLLFDEAAMVLHGTRALKHLGQPQIEHPLRLPLNHMITLGDEIWLKKDSKLGGSGFIKLLVTFYQHVLSREFSQRQTTVTGLEFL